MEIRRRSVALSALLTLAVGGGAVVYQSQLSPPAALTTAHNSEPLVRSHSPALGPAHATVHVVKFLDPASVAVRDIYPFVKGLMLTHSGDTRLSIRYAPAHRGSVEVIRMLEAARKQGKFWESLDLLLVFQSKWVVQQAVQADLAWKFLDASRMVDMERLRIDMESPEIAQIIAQDLTDAQTLNVANTSGLFVNGTPVPAARPEPIQLLVNDALTRATRHP